jgi:hypothetical protein
MTDETRDTCLSLFVPQLRHFPNACDEDRLGRMALVAFRFPVGDLLCGSLIDFINPCLRVHRIFPFSPDSRVAAFTFPVLKSLICFCHAMCIVFGTQRKVNRYYN